MMKRMWLILTVLTVLGLAAGCACAVEPTPTPTPVPSASPNTTPDTVTPNTTPDMTPNGGMEGESATIPNFLAGTVMALEDLPEKIRGALDREFPEAKVQSVTHAEHEKNQVYSIILTDKEGKEHTLYIAPNGNIIPEVKPGVETGSDPAVTPDASASPAPAASPSASPNP